jgi:hypothetical protein
LLTRPQWKPLPLHYGLYTITNILGENDFELNIAPFFVMHPIFNVALVELYFPPLLNTSKIEEKLTPT